MEKSYNRMHNLLKDKKFESGTKEAANFIIDPINKDKFFGDIDQLTQMQYDDIITYTNKNINIPVEKENFNKIYESKLKEFDDIRKRRCMYCGMNEGDTVDHFFPKSEYGLYVVYEKNMVSCCSKCNKKKGTKLLRHPDEYVIKDFTLEGEIILNAISKSTLRIANIEFKYLNETKKDVCDTVITLDLLDRYYFNIIKDELDTYENRSEKEILERLKNEANTIASDKKIKFGMIAKKALQENRISYN